jgi:hypothetical protein
VSLSVTARSREGGERAHDRGHRWVRQLGALTPDTRVITIAASSREVPKFARMEFDDLAAVEARTGMTSHGE